MGLDGKVSACAVFKDIENVATATATIFLSHMTTPVTLDRKRDGVRKGGRLHPLPNIAHAILPRFEFLLILVRGWSGAFDHRESFWIEADAIARKSTLDRDITL